MGKIKKISNDSHIQILSKVARISKMDCWFFIDEDGYCVDLENNSKRISAKKGVHDLLDGLCSTDIEALTPNEIITLVDCVISFMK